MAEDGKIFGQIQELSPPLNAIVYKDRCPFHTLLYAVEDSAIEALRKLANEVGSCPQNLLTTHMKAALSGIPKNRDGFGGLDIDVRLVLVINEYKNRVFVEDPDESAADGCCIIE